VARDEQPNQGMEPTTYSVRYAPASGSGSCLALDEEKKTIGVLSMTDAMQETEGARPGLNPQVTLLHFTEDEKEIV
jgi:hypothetical protein